MQENKILNLIKKFTNFDFIKFLGIDLSQNLHDFLKDKNYTNTNEFQKLLIEFFQKFNAKYPEQEAELLFFDLWQYAELLAYENELKVLNVKKVKQSTKLKNRAKYLPTVVLSRENAQSNGKDRWRGFTMLLANGLLKEIEEHYTKKNALISFSIQNNLNPVINDSGEEVKPFIEKDIWKSLESQNILVSGYRVAWLKNTYAFNLLKKALPNYIDFRSYNHSLNAPLLPNGFLPGADCIMMNIPTIGEVSAKTDGCGRIHPEHELFKNLNRPGGACTIQFRGLNHNGTFVKGILVPDERCISKEGLPEIWLDWKQVKGFKKKEAAKLNAENKVISTKFDIGILQAWDRPRKLKLSFQQLQLIDTNEKTIEIVKQWVDEAYDKLLKNGIESLFSAIASKDEKVNLTLKICAAIKQKVPEFSPLQIPYIRNLLIERLQKTAYFLAQGAGKYTKQYVVAIDAGVPEGTCVLNGFKVGEEVLMYRFPTILPQALVKLKVTKPLKHHLINKKILRETIFLNPKDITDKSQGDSDGDIVGITNDSRAIELYNHKLDENRVYLVEPESNKMELSEEAGIEYIRSDPMGPVGRMCIYQAQMFAIGNLRAAIALSLPYQESVDAGKNIVNYSNFTLAENLENWQLENNRYKFTERLTYSQEDMQEAVLGYVKSCMNDAGIDTEKRINVLGWRYKNKRINVAKWETTEQRTNWAGGNLVHICHDYAREVWLNKYKALFPESLINKEENEDFVSVNSIDVSDIIAKYLKLSFDFKPLNIDFKTYKRTLYQKSGFAKFNQEFYNLNQNQNIDPEYKTNQINLLFIELNNNLSKLTIEELECIWRLELTDIYEHSDENNLTYYSSEPNGFRKNKPNTAFRAISFPNSPILNFLGIKTTSICNYLTQENSFKIDLIIDELLEKENPYKSLVDAFYLLTDHGEKMKDLNNEPIELHQCAHCKSILSDTLVTKIRLRKTTEEYTLIKNLCKVLNN